MKFIIHCLLAIGVVFGAVGCSEKSTVTRETKVTTPTGETTTTTKQEVKKSGENPPPATP
jgi:hypothetical protein